MQRNYKSTSKESAFTPSGLSDSPLSAEVSLFNTMETKQIPEFPNYYVSKNGEVFSGATGKWITLKHDINWAGYHRVTLHRGGVKYKRSVHRLVAEVFILNPQKYKEINHINFDRGDNRVENLEWTSRLVNQQYSIQAGRRDHIVGEGHHRALLTESQVREIRRLYIPKKFPAIRLAKMFGIGRREVSSIVNYETWKNVL